MSCCGRIPTAEIRRAIRRRRGCRWACSVLAPAASPSASEENNLYRELLRMWLRLGDGFDGRHPSCTARRSDKRRVPTH
jgi:hypothetical protein